MGTDPVRVENTEETLLFHAFSTNVEHDPSDALRTSLATSNALQAPDHPKERFSSGAPILI